MENEFNCEQCGDSISFQGLCDNCTGKKIQVEEFYYGSGGL